MISYIKINKKKIIILLSYFGLIPFIYPLIEDELHHSIFESIQVGSIIMYGTTILCFLSGSYWGIGLYLHFKKISNYFYCLLSMIPFFIGLTSAFIKNYNNVLLLIIGFLVCQVFDENLYKIGFYDKWYLILRRILTLVVVTILFFTYIKYSYV